jgi:3-methyladenine DNA glycosylase AlkD
MNVKEVLKELESLGTEQNRKIYMRHGADENTYGVSFANQGKLKKKYKGQHELGVGLWESGNSDAMTLGISIMDPNKVTEKEADKWVKKVSNRHHTDCLAAVVVQTDFYKKKIDEWTKSQDEFIKRTGYTLISLTAKLKERPGDSFYEKYIGKIEKEIGKAPNWAKDGMNSTLLAIGWNIASLKDRVMEAAKKIGTVEIDHGETSCTTVDVAASLKAKKFVRK